jgi:hypothetical protein
MAQKYWYYIDWGGGFTNVSPEDINVSLKLKRGVVNDFVQRKELDGDFKLTNNSGKTDFTDAKTYFRTNGNEEAPIRLYENGDSGSGVLQYEGWARVSGNWNNRESIVSLNSFRTNDEYTDILENLNNAFQGESLVGFASFGAFASQGQNANANKLLSLTWDGTNFSITAGTAFSFPNLGRCAVDRVGTEINLFDNVSNTLTSYVISSGQWSQVRSATVPVSAFQYSNCTIAPTSATTFDLIGDNSNLTLSVTYSGASSYSFGSATSFDEIKFPSACWTGTRIAVVDELQRKIRTSGASIDVGKVFRPQVCVYTEVNERIAFIDAELRNLQMYQYSGGTYIKVGNPLYIPGLLAPTISRYNPTGDVMIHDTILGTLEMYTFSGTNWSQVGNTFNIGGGYMSAITHYSTDIMLAISDTHVFNGSIMTNYYGAINSLLLLQSLWGTGAGQYELQSSATGATKDPNEIVLGAMSDIADNSEDAGNLNKFKFKLGETLKWYEMFQNYWYIADVGGAYKIRFIQPDSFSTAGTDINISALSFTPELNQEDLKIDQEELILNNVNNPDFEDNVIDYLRNTSVKQDVPFPFTTDLEYLIQIYTGQIIQNVNGSGLIMYFKDDSTGARLAVSGTGIISGSDVKNYLLSQSQIYNDEWSTYRYKEQGNIDYNGLSNPVGDSVRNIIEYTEVKGSESIFGLTQFPASMGSLIWGGGHPNGLMMEISLNLNTREYTILSRLHDI